MSGKTCEPVGVKAISVFYLIGMVAVAIALFSNRAATGAQLASVHGMPALDPVPAILLTLVAGALVVAGLNSARPWGFWLVIAYMTYLLLYPPYAIGADAVSPFANVVWPLVVMLYLLVKRRSFGVGLSA